MARRKYNHPEQVHIWEWEATGGIRFIPPYSSNMYTSISNGQITQEYILEITEEVFNNQI